MATKDLAFEKKENGRYAAAFTSQGVRTVVQLEREERSDIVVYLRINGMAGHGASPAFYGASENFMFEVNVPQGVEVEVESLTQVTTAKLLEE